MNSRSIRAILYALSSVIAVIGTPNLANAQEAEPMAEIHCMACLNLPAPFGPFGPEDAHIFGAHAGGQFWNNMDCHAFNACHTNFDQPGYCAKFHYVCESGPHALEQTREAVRANDTDLLVTLASTQNGHVRIVGDYALVLGCDRTTLIGAVRLPTALARIRYALPPLDSPRPGPA